MAGRSVLIQVASSAIPAYVMQSCMLPGKVLEGIDRVNRNFLWGSSENKKKIHWVGWSKVTRPKLDGGLGIQAARGRSTALLAKLNWRFHTEEKAPWARVLRLKYCNHQRLNSRNSNKLSTSRVWKSLKKGEEIFKKGTRWFPGADSNLDFWQDNWAGIGPLRQAIQGPLTLEASRIKVKEVGHFSGWDWDMLQMELPKNIQREILATPIPLAARAEDKLAWKLSAKGDFDLKSAYSLTLSPSSEVPFKGKWIWKLNTLPRIQSFVWQCMHHSISVRECLTARGMDIDNSCPICRNGPESILHALRDCPSARDIWHQLGVPPSDSVFFVANLKDWLVSNCNSKLRQRAGQLPWFQVFLFAIWMIWKNRNHFVFKGTMQYPNVAKEILGRVMEYTYCAYSHTAVKRMMMKSIRWEKPNSGWKKLNTDGSSADSLGLAGGGGVVRDEHGSWVLGFARKFGPVNSFLAELWSLRDGLLLCVDCGPKSKR
ncbi:hypothetical protein RGQ29_028437 [Quercus rubra]|uniref:Reverse transcriptase zinc-binding domain-containing protein n=1 Tax=Quercus rubra TaxID=3512 RepID=A0AAN7IIV3_QUERU|nr:hypothetical protein RGQ29_028437 [Quercus rubra]